MKKIVMGVVVMLLLTGHSAFAAIQYDFFQSSRGDGEQGSSDFNARAVIDGQRSRVEFISGNTYPPGTYVISTDGARRLLFVDPTQKIYTEVNTLGIASAIGTSNISITNLLSSVTKLDDTKVIAGIPTDHYRLTITYDITVTFRNMPLKQSVRTIDRQVDDGSVRRCVRHGVLELGADGQRADRRTDHGGDDEDQGLPAAADRSRSPRSTTLRKQIQSSCYRPHARSRARRRSRRSARWPRTTRCSGFRPVTHRTTTPSRSQSRRHRF